MSGIESIIREAMARGDFDNLPGAGKPIDLDTYFDTPEDVRAAYAILKNAGILPQEIELLQDIAALKEKLAAEKTEGEQSHLRKEIEKKQLEFNLLTERQQKERRSAPK
ncbi:MAG: DUF1992 domain-containing protein [Chloroflexota bacterium]